MYMRGAASSALPTCFGLPMSGRMNLSVICVCVLDVTKKKLIVLVATYGTYLVTTHHGLVLYHTETIMYNLYVRYGT